MRNIFVFLFLACGQVNSFITTTTNLNHEAFNAVKVSSTLSTALSLNRPQRNSNMNANDVNNRKEKNFKSLPHPGLSRRVSERYNLNRGLQTDSYQLRKRKRRKQAPNLNTMSAIANTDVLPSFRAAHGLLHPHTVMKLQEQHESEGSKNDAVTYFLDTYDQYGPMACLPCLTDPDVLPNLTDAMRKINS